MIFRPVPVTYLLPFVARPLIGNGVHTAHALGTVLGPGVMVIMLLTAPLLPKDWAAA